MRQEFKDIVAGWTLVNDFNTLTNKIEIAAEWTKANGPLEPDEERVIESMIHTQVALGIEIEGFFTQEM